MNLLCGELDAYKFVKPGKLNNTQLKLIIEDINKPQYIVCESSGKTLLLEDAIFMPTEYLITEGVFDKVTAKIKELITKIVNRNKSGFK
jgi:hypothetical protein